jgi:hypothetical protein
MDTKKLSNSLFTKTQQRVLGLLFGAPGKSFYTNEIVRIAAIGRGTVTRELAKLAEAGVLTVSPAGNQRHYQANQDCPVYGELVKIARKLFEIDIPVSKPKPVRAEPEIVRKSGVKKAGKPKAVIKKVVKKKAVINAEPLPEEPPVVDDEGQLGLF